MILTIVATVSERHAPPSHTNTQLGGACLSETVATIIIVKIILSQINRRMKKTGYYSYEEVRVLHIYISLIIYKMIFNMEL